MKKLIFTLMTAVLALSSCNGGAQSQKFVKVVGNKFIDRDGKEIIFRGLCYSDPNKLVREGHWNDEYFAQAAEWGANIVRFAVHPADLNRTGWEKTFQYMDEGIELAKKYNMYVIMDWHSIGNLREEKYTSGMYNTTKAETFKFWRTVAQRYKNEPAVALYEVFNEPTITAPNVGTSTWAQWRELQEQIIDTIRAYNPNAVCLCAGFNWAYNLPDVATDPIRRENVAYVSHPYPMKSGEPWEENWEKEFGYVADTYPVICTEIGFCLENEPGAHVPVMSTGIYADRITKYFEKKGISFTVWCFDTSWAPTLISDWKFTPTTQGKKFKAYLQESKKTMKAPAVNLQ